ncbi:DeoR/GlpR family DNA-binding transcription regulator [Cereibacter sphaeroides]|uniref:DeoR/GlpR family DNA-binding transcription regulator n=1 Tax=Cereibacter sphaeroides TaxID=1063 RepID=UPI0022790D35|nr:DeoR/GlpR family DNA-binding transcription regulator [Cereibacter sphaeroides]MCE6969916.1 DeoR/GlpR family DNA-binding transcription regulator [Cereibacter sphaeroides]
MHDSPDLPVERRRRIADRLATGQAVVAATLAQEFGVSEDSIRRDLRGLAQDGICRRVYGGALPVSPAAAPMAVRAGEDRERKRALARAALDLLRPGQTIFLDTGSTNLQLAALLPEGLGLRVVTNSIPAAAVLTARRDLSLVVIGGGVNPQVGGCVDARASAELSGCRFDLCFLGACAMSPEHGLAGFELDDVEFKRRLVAVSAATVLMMTTAKLATSAPFAIARVADLTHVVLEHDAPAGVVEALRSAGIDLRSAAAPT